MMLWCCDFRGPLRCGLRQVSYDFFGAFFNIITVKAKAKRHLERRRETSTNVSTLVERSLRGRDCRRASQPMFIAIVP